MQKTAYCIQMLDMEVAGGYLLQENSYCSRNIMPTLRLVASFRLGHSFRSRIDSRTDGAVAVIQMRDVPDAGVVNSDTLARISGAEVSRAEPVRPGDIVVTTRGEVARAAIVPSGLGSAIVAAPLLRIRVTSPDVMPAYLVWYLNGAKAQAELGRTAEGSNVKMIGRAALEALDVELPSIERQCAIVELAGHVARERLLQDQLQARRNQLLSHVMMHFAEGGTR